MLDWNTVIRLANEGTPEPDRVVRKSDEEWRAQLSDEQYRVTRKKGTERPFSSEMCSLFEPGLYRCVCCDTLLFDAGEKFESGTGWPSFTQPVKPNAVAYHADPSHGMTRIETTCNSCGAHLGHVFPDGPPPTGLRYCINAVALQKEKAALDRATFGGGCFWCTEAIFRELAGVHAVESGYSGGAMENPDYASVCSGTTGHAEVVQLQFDPGKVDYETLLARFFEMHNPTTLNRQGPDIGSQYRSVVFFHSAGQELAAQKAIEEINHSGRWPQPLVTQVEPARQFWPAEEYHQDYEKRNPYNGYVQRVSIPRLNRMKAKFPDLLKKMTCTRSL